MSQPVTGRSRRRQGASRPAGTQDDEYDRAARAGLPADGNLAPEAV